MDSQYWITMGLFVLGFAIAIRIGWLAGIHFATSQFTEERRAAVEEEIRQKYYARIEQEFCIAVEKRAHEIVDECLKIMEEKENENESSGSN